jgi:hypothetical protein
MEHRPVPPFFPGFLERNAARVSLADGAPTHPRMQGDPQMDTHENATDKVVDAVDRAIERLEDVRDFNTAHSPGVTQALGIALADSKPALDDNELEAAANVIAGLVLDAARERRRDLAEGKPDA